MNAPNETQTHPLSYAVERIGAPSEDWLLRQVRAGRLPARKIARGVWRMTDSDIAAAIAILASPARNAAPSRPTVAAAADSDGLTPSARRRLAARARSVA